MTETVWSAAALTGYVLKSVKWYVEVRAGGWNAFECERRLKMFEAFLEEVKEWVEQFNATIRADVVHEELVKMGFGGSERLTGRAVNAVKTAW